MTQQRNTIFIFSAVLAISPVNAECRLIRAKSEDHFECIMQNKANFRKDEMSVSLYNRKTYENICVCRLPKNKAKQTQFVFLTAENAEYAEMKNICVSACSIEKYGLYPVSPCSLRTRRLMKNKPNQSQFVFFTGENAEFAELLLFKDLCQCNSIKHNSLPVALFPLTSSSAGDYNEIFCLMSCLERTPSERVWK
jgi:hypothetical protein